MSQQSGPVVSSAGFTVFCCVAMGTIVVKGVSREQQVWILDLVSVLI